VELLKKYWPFVLIVGMVAWFVMWALPAYKKVQKDSSEKDTKIATLQKKIDSWKNSSTIRSTFFPDGRLKSTTSKVVSSGISSIETSAETSTHSADKHELIVTKRGLLNVNVYWDIKALNPMPKAYSGAYQMGFVGPAVFVQPDPFIGLAGLGVYF
jgi:hypothetical protein